MTDQVKDNELTEAVNNTSMDQEDTIPTDQQTPVVSQGASTTEITSDASIKPVLSYSEPASPHDSTSIVKDQEGNLVGESKQNPILQEYWNACQTGDYPTVKRLISSHAVDITADFDPAPSERITGLHWAAINNRLDIVKYLVSQGADPNFQSGAMRATPLHWAARYGYVHVVDYLIRVGGADVTLCDDQGFNLLHLAVNSSNIMLVAYVLFFCCVDTNATHAQLDINAVDPKGRSALLWAAYQGDSLTVKMLLRFGADLRLLDEGGFTALHWGCVKGQMHVLKMLIQAGGDVFQKTGDGKDCFMICDELKTRYALNQALATCGYTEQGYVIPKFFKKPEHAKLLTFLVPIWFIGATLYTFDVFRLLPAMVLTILHGVVVNRLLYKFVLPSYIPRRIDDENKGRIFNSHRETLSRSPLLAGIFFGSLIWLTVLTLKNSELTLKNFLSPLSQIFINVVPPTYVLFSRLVFSDPGVIPEATLGQDLETIRTTILQLLEIGKFDTENFCIETWIRKPKRSKFSTFSNGVIMRFDHYCPWVYNDIGLRNHKIFLIFIFLIELGIFTFTAITLQRFDQLEELYEGNTNRHGVAELTCSWTFGNDELCYGWVYDRSTFVFLVWSLFQSVWVGFLIAVQLFQIIVGVTNYEFNTYSRENRRRKNFLAGGSMRNENFNTAPEELRNVHGDETDLDGTELPNEDATRLDVPQNDRRNFFKFLFKLTGISQLVAILKETIGCSDTRSNSGSRGILKNLGSIPTNYGWKQNIIDFWMSSDVKAPFYSRFLGSPTSSKALLNGSEVDYSKLYELPTRDIPQSGTVEMV